MQARYAEINESLRLKVGLEILYDHEVVEVLRHEIGFAAGVTALNPPIGSKTHISLCRGLQEKSAISIYLHEVAHVIANNFDLTDAPHALFHNKYFAVLAATMYRRADLLNTLTLYEFCDTRTRLNGINGDLPSDSEMISRFNYIVRRSGYYSKSSFSIEQIASELKNDLALEIQQVEKREKKKGKSDSKEPWFYRLFAAVVGSSITAAAIAFVVITWSH